MPIVAAKTLPSRLYVPRPAFMPGSVTSSPGITRALPFSTISLHTVWNLLTLAALEKLQLGAALGLLVQLVYEVVLHARGDFDDAYPRPVGLPLFLHYFPHGLEVAVRLSVVLA